MANRLIRKATGTGDEMDGDGDWIKVSFGDHQVLMARETFEFYEPKSLTLECRESGLMSSHKVSHSDTSTVQHRTTIRELPDEMVSNIFKCLGTNDLLRRCRLVCKSWKNISTELCRRRFVELKSYFEDDEDERKGDNIFTLFDMENLPWSSYSFPHNSAYPTENDEFLRLFGKQIWDLTLKQVDEDTCKRILCHTPNIRQMHIYMSGKVADFTTQESSSSAEGLDLRRLKRLRFDFKGDSDVEFLKYIITTGKAKLDYFKSMCRINNSEALGMVASLLANVPSIALEIVYTPSKPNGFEDLLTNYQNLRITELDLYMDRFKREGVREYPIINYHLPEQFIATHSDHLEMLHVRFYDVHSIPFNFPSLPALTCLSLTGVEPSPTGFLSLLQSDNFPVLDEVRIRADDWISAYSNSHLYLPDNCCFEFVSKLTLDTQSPVVRVDLRRVFPNLKSFNFISILNSETLLECFSWTTLEDLTLRFGVERTGMDMNALLSGIPNPNATYEKSEKEIAQERERHGRPSILQLTRLKNLEITTRSNEYPRDPGPYLALLPLQPLNLTLGRARLSEECIRKLDAHHRNFRIL